MFYTKKLKKLAAGNSHGEMAIGHMSKLESTIVRYVWSGVDNSPLWSELKFWGHGEEILISM